MKRNILAVIMSVALAVTMFTGCGAQGRENLTADAQDSAASGQEDAGDGVGLHLGQTMAGPAGDSNSEWEEGSGRF